MGAEEAERASRQWTGFFALGSVCAVVAVIVRRVGRANE
jgi:hypothetical protein